MQACARQSCGLLHQGLWTGKGCSGGSRASWAPSARLRSCLTPRLLQCLKLYNLRSCSLLSCLLSSLSAYSAYCTPVYSRNDFSGCRGRITKKKKSFRIGRNCLMEQRMCVVRFFLFGFNCTPCGTCCGSARCCALTMNVNITVLAMANGKAVPQIGSLSRIGGWCFCKQRCLFSLLHTLITM